MRGKVREGEGWKKEGEGRGGGERETRERREKRRWDVLKSVFQPLTLSACHPTTGQFLEKTYF